ncbi:uncharacterized protein EAE97_003647 [Botrytis byssoidea]|uniref:Uncharacterized protein n=1 Tax=Botrytis byssoidea TaxID=139641 RepID=A0A9P5IUT1_9HELO|nr:uncharacterized protein EAE97_003647 [Botrytis byssoidea]KAF7948236.1 hypothetical protein EAE97_003647 [Botrytis byssoidea]
MWSASPVTFPVTYQMPTHENCNRVVRGRGGRGGRTIKGGRVSRGGRGGRGTGTRADTSKQQVSEENCVSPWAVADPSGWN